MRRVLKINRFSVFLILTVLWGQVSGYHLAEGNSDLDRTGQQYYPVLEWQVTNSTYTRNPYDVVAEVTFTHSSGITKKTQMFYNRNDEWAFRFSAPLTGIWTFATSSLDSDLNDLTGSVTILPNPDSNGYLTHVADKWMWSGVQKTFIPQFVMFPDPDVYFENPDFIEAYIDTFFVQHGFNGFHTQVFCRWFNINKVKWDEVSEDPNPDTRTFEALELLISKVYEAGGAVHIWQWGQTASRQTPFHWGINGPVDRRLQRYIAARLGPLPGWSMGYGYDCFEWVTREQLRVWHETMHLYFGWFHFLGARPEGPRTSSDPVSQLYDDLDYASHEQWRPDYDEYVRVIQADPYKPAFSEDRFRIRDPSPNPAKDYDEKRTRRGLYLSTMAGGVANIWGNLIGAQFGGSAPYEHPEWSRNYANFFDTRFLPDMIRDNTLTDGYGLRTPLHTHFIFYKKDADYIDVDLSGAVDSLPLVAVDTEHAAYVEISDGEYSATSHRWWAPYNSDWILAVGNFGNEDPPTSVIFTNITEPAGLSTQIGAHAAVFADVTENGLPDIYTTRVADDDLTDLFFRNSQSGSFYSEGDDRGIADLDGGSHGACFADLDNDGDYDLVNGTTYRISSGDGEYNNLFENTGGGHFIDRSPQNPDVSESLEKTRAILAFDVENDGDLDIVSVTGWRGNDDPVDETNEVFINQGNWHFVSDEGGDLHDAPICQGGTDTDFDGDGDIDLISANRTGDLNILRNDGQGNFSRLNPANLGIIHSGGDGITMGDIDNDKDLDMLLVTEGPPSEAHLYRNDGTGSFSFVQSWSDVEGYMGAFGDIDNDGDVDLVFAGDGVCYLNDGSGYFIPGYDLDVEGVVDPRSVAVADIDKDGDIDFWITDKREESHLIQNNLISSMNWLEVKLVSPTGQAGAFGSKVSVFAAGDMEGNLVGFREARSNNGYLGQNDPVLHFGLRSHVFVDVLVEFPDGNRAELTEVAVNQVLEVIGGTQAFAVEGPDGGEYWYISSSRNITWTPIGEEGSVKIEISRNAGADWSVLMENTPDDGTQSWIVEGAPSDSCYIRISDSDGLPMDQSDDPFIIMDFPKLMFSNPAWRSYAGVTSVPLIFEFNKINGEPISAPLDFNFIPTSTSAFGTFSTRPFPWTPISSFTIPAGSSSVVLYYKDGIAGTPELRISESPDREWIEAVQSPIIDPSEPPHVPHTLYGTLRSLEGAIPEHDMLYFWTYITTRPSSRLDQDAQSCGYDDGTWWIECANFSEGWVMGDTVHVDFLHTSTGETESIQWVLGEEAEEDYGEVVVRFHAPTLLSVPDQTILEGQSFDPVFLDEFIFHPDYEDSLLNWDYLGDQDLIVSLESRVLSVAAPDSEWFGSETLSLLASDTDGWKDSIDVRFTVIPENDPPRWILSNNFEYNEDDTLGIPFSTLRQRVSDIDDDPSTFEFWAEENELVEVSIDTATETIIFQSPENWCGTTELVMYVADVLGSTDADTAQITVNPVPDRPGPFTIVTPILEEIDQWPDSLLFIWETPVDVDPGDALVYEWHLLKEGSSGDIPFKATVLDTMYCLFPGEEFDSGTYLWWVVVEDMYHLTRESNYGTIVVGSTGISHDGQDVPDAFDLLQNMPNPFNQQTRIPFHIPEPVHVIVHVFNAMGREICVLVDEKKEAGRYEAVWSTGSGSGTPVGSGMYIIRMEAGSYTAVRKILLVR